jgi:predicted cupin superfamily sugar epimerase
MSIQELISHYRLEPHPEGGFYRQTYVAGLSLPEKSLGGDFKGDRPASTAIYFLLPQSTFSAFHRIKSDELWHHYAGGTLLIHVIFPDGRYTQLRLGSDLSEGEAFQHVVPAGTWFASEPIDGADFVLVGCTVSPGFDFRDFELADRSRLSMDYPQHSELISLLTRL